MTEPAHIEQSSPTIACRWLLGGRVQGVGFRPFVYRLALRHRLRGWIRNSSGSVEILAQGEATALTVFEQALFQEAPYPATPRLIRRSDAAVTALDGFVIEKSAGAGESGVTVLPDQTLCEHCRAEIDDPGDRRYRYPFTSCARCGPRYSIISALPYDRAQTTMRGFHLCAACRREYHDPGDRRFHAQTNACPDCGPELQYRDSRGANHAAQAALAASVALLRDGGIVAVKGVGGYHLLCDAANEAAIARLRLSKPRPDKPLAVMFPDDALEQLAGAVQLDAMSSETLHDPARPIVLAPLRKGHRLAGNIAPGLDEIGVMLPYSPLHHLLLKDFGAPLIATSANPGGEPVLIDADQVERHLSGVADGFLHHDRPIHRQADDPVYRIIAGAARPLRIGRGNAPRVIPLPFTLSEPLLAVGGHMKSTIALGIGNQALLSPHIGDLDSPRGRALFEATIAGLQSLHGVRASRVVCDAHPGYPSRSWARDCGLPVIEVLHHAAHAAIVAGDAAHPSPWLVFAWDGIGYGADGSFWGGEALLGGPGRWQRVASFRPFRIPGGNRAGREPWRSALALCLEQGRDWPACPRDRDIVTHAWRRDLNCTRTSSVGRLFDAAAAMVGGMHETSYEGQGPMWLEARAATAPALRGPLLPSSVDAAGLLVTDWSGLLDMLLDNDADPARRAAMFHDSLARALLDQAEMLRSRHGVFTVGLSGGVFQNRLLAEAVIRLLGDRGFDVRLPSSVPYNDAGLSYGQLIEAAAVGGLIAQP